MEFDFLQIVLQKKKKKKTFYELQLLNSVYDSQTKPKSEINKRTPNQSVEYEPHYIFLALK